MSTCTWSWSSSTGPRGALSLAPKPWVAMHTGPASALGRAVPCRMLYHAGSAASEAIHSFIRAHYAIHSRRRYLLSGRLARLRVGAQVPARSAHAAQISRRSTSCRPSCIAAADAAAPAAGRACAAQRLCQYTVEPARCCLSTISPLGVRWCLTHRSSVRQHPIECVSTRSRDRRRHRVSP